MDAITAKVVIAFFYMLGGDLVSYTVSDYESFAVEEKISPGRTCTALIRDVGFMESVRSGLTLGEVMRAGCYTTRDIMVLGAPDATVSISKDTTGTCNPRHPNRPRNQSGVSCSRCSGS